MPKPVTPLIAADIIIELADRPDRPIVLIERKNPPYGWAIPGGFVDEGENCENAAIREAEEETCCRVTLKALLGIYSHPARDNRGYTVSAVYVAEAHGEPEAADDAKSVVIVDPDNPPTPLAFDHALILEHYRQWRRDGSITPLAAPIDQRS
ncbi:NUDIX domain-containing protein [Magnetofaba australis]|nr:NUDIX hydrolase [Magnetofaba australis]